MSDHPVSDVTIYSPGRKCPICQSEGFALEPTDGMRCTLCSGRFRNKLLVLDERGMTELRAEHARCTR